MRRVIRALIALIAFLPAAGARAEVLVRWDQAQVPSPTSLRIRTLVVPAGNTAAIESALAQGYRLYLEVDAANVSTLVVPAGDVAGVLVSGKVSPLQLRQLRQRVGSSRRVVALEQGGKWPHIRSNWVTKNNNVLQVTGRSAQPWIENNAALLRIAARARGQAVNREPWPILTYSWKPITLSDVDEGPSLDNYLVAIAESGSFGGDLLLPLHERFERNLLVGHPQARNDWQAIHRYIEFYSWNLPDRYEPIANVGVVTSEPVLWFEVMNLLARHNVPFELIPPATLSTRPLTAFDLLIVLDEPKGKQVEALAEFERKGGQVTKMLKGVPDPNVFALDIRQKLGREHRVVDIWNGITVLTTPYRQPTDGSVLLTVLNYAHQLLPVQLRVRGTFTQVQYESPEEGLTLLSRSHRDGYTEFVIPGLRIGGRVFLRR